MALNAHTDPMTEAQREELKRLCDEADIPDRSGELLTRTGAQQMIDESQGCRASIKDLSYTMLGLGTKPGPASSCRGPAAPARTSARMVSVRPAEAMRMGRKNPR